MRWVIYAHFFAFGANVALSWFITGNVVAVLITGFAAIGLAVFHGRR